MLLGLSALHSSTAVEMLLDIDLIRSLYSDVNTCNTEVFWLYFRNTVYFTFLHLVCFVLSFLIQGVFACVLFETLPPALPLSLCLLMSSTSHGCHQSQCYHGNCLRWYASFLALVLEWR